MKNKLKPMLAAILGLCLIFALTACGGKDPDTGKTPTSSDWSAVGIDGGFNANVKGTLVTNKAGSGAIEMKWTDSDEDSLDNTIAWLRGQSFTSYGTSASGKEYAEGGAVISYTAAKTTSASSGGGGMGGLLYAAPMRAAAAESGKTVVAEAVYVTKDVSFGGMSMKAGELYVDISEETETTIPSPTTTTSQATPPAADRRAAKPAYTGPATSYSTQTNKLGVGFAQVIVYGAQQSGAAAYRDALVSNGFVSDADENTDMDDPNEANAVNYVKTLDSGNRIIVNCAFMGMNDVMSGNFTGDMEYVVMITARLEKTTGDLTAWPANRMSAFPGLPAYAGASATYDFEDAWAEMGVTMPAMPDIGSMLPGMDLDAFINMLPAEEREEARAALRMYEEVRKSFQYIRVYLVTVYDTTETEVNTYKSALTNAGFALGSDGYAKKITVGGVEMAAMIGIDFDGGNIARISLTRMPQAFLDYADDEYPDDPDDPFVPDDPDDPFVPGGSGLPMTEAQSRAALENLENGYALVYSKTVGYLESTLYIGAVSDASWVYWLDSDGNWYGHGFARVTGGYQQYNIDNEGVWAAEGDGVFPEPRFTATEEAEVMKAMFYVYDWADGLTAFGENGVASRDGTRYFVGSNPYSPNLMFTVDDELGFTIQTIIFSTQTTYTLSDCDFDSPAVPFLP